MKKYFFNVTIAIISNESAVVMYVFPKKFVVAVDGVQMHCWMLWNNQFIITIKLLAATSILLSSTNSTPYML